MRGWLARRGVARAGMAAAAASRAIWDDGGAGGAAAGAAAGGGAWAAEQLARAAAHVAATVGAEPAQPRAELARRAAASKLRSRLVKGVKEAARAGSKDGKAGPRARAPSGKVPPLAYERWACRDALRQDRERGELLLPCSGVPDAGLARDLSRHALGGRAAQEVAAALAKAGKAAAAKLVGGGGGADELERVHCTRRGELFNVTLGHPEAKPYFVVSEAHLDKLQTLYLRNLPPGARSASVDEAEQKFLRALFCLLCRYDAVGGAGYQCAVPAAGFDALREAVCAGGECFASPLNCRTGSYCSAFADVDAPFGSSGNFLDFYPERGSYEANPVFVPETMSAMAEHVEGLLGAAAAGAPSRYGKGGGKRGKPRALSFAVIVPVWRECKFYSALMGSTFRRGEPLMLPADEHVYVDGAQHSRPAAERERPSSYDTAIFFLQTDEAAEKWPVGEQQRTCIRAAMRPLADKGERKGAGGVQDRLREIERRNKRRKLAGTR